MTGRCSLPRCTYSLRTFNSSDIATLYIFASDIQCFRYCHVVHICFGHSLFSDMAPANQTPFTMMHLNSRAFRCFLHDVHHAYLLLHRAMQTLPPTAIPDLEPMPHPSEGIPDQPEGLQPTGPLADAPELPSPIFKTHLLKSMIPRRKPFSTRS